MLYFRPRALRPRSIRKYLFVEFVLFRGKIIENKFVRGCFRMLFGARKNEGIDFCGYRPALGTECAQIKLILHYNYLGSTMTSDDPFNKSKRLSSWMRANKNLQIHVCFSFQRIPISISSFDLVSERVLVYQHLLFLQLLHLICSFNRLKSRPLEDPINLFCISVNHHLQISYSPSTDRYVK